jgi:hypothetical protein
MNIVAVDDHVAQVNADAKNEPLVVSGGRLVPGDTGLPRHGAGQGVDHAGELDQEAVADELDDAAMMLGDERLKNVLAKLREAP